jgi:hypothetical protein
VQEYTGGKRNWKLEDNLPDKNKNIEKLRREKSTIEKRELNHTKAIAEAIETHHEANRLLVAVQASQRVSLRAHKIRQDHNVERGARR